MDVEVVLSLVPYLVFSIITSSYSWQYVYVFEIDAPATKSLMSGTYIIFKNFSIRHLHYKFSPWGVFFIHTVACVLISLWRVLHTSEKLCHCLCENLHIKFISNNDTFVQTEHVVRH